MDPVAITVGLSWTLSGLLIIVLAIPLIRQKVGRNALYGIRLPASFQSEQAWFAINRYGGRQLLGWAVPIVLVGIVCFFLPLRSHPGLALIVGLVPLVFIVVPVVQVTRFARRYR